MSKQEIVVLASGTGSNFKCLVDAVNDGRIEARIRCLITDRECGAVDLAKQYNISYFVLPKTNDKHQNLNVQAMLCHGADLIVCAGYLSILNPSFVSVFKGKIINIHPSLLPKFGGRGMYGIHIHQAVLEAGENETGCTVHFVDSGIDTGPLIDQAFVKVSSLDDAYSLQKKVLDQEHILLPKVVQYLLTHLPQIS